MSTGVLGSGSALVVPCNLLHCSLDIVDQILQESLCLPLVALTWRMATVASGPAKPGVLQNAQ